MANISKDDKIIRDNPGLSPEELLKKGLSEKKYEDLLKAPKEVPSVKKIVPEIQPARPMPKLTVITHVPVTDQVLLRTPDGKTTPMALKAAQKLVRKNPNYKII